MCVLPDYLIRILAPLTIVAALVASHPASQTALDAIGDQLHTAWTEWVRADDCAMQDGARCTIQTAQSVGDRPVRF